MEHLLQLGMSWDLAIETLGWRGTRDEWIALVRRVDIIRAAESPGGHHG